MGSSHSHLTQDELEDYQNLTHLRRKEILEAFRLFYELDPDSVNHNKHGRIPQEDFYKLPLLQCNPFKERLCKVFSSQQDGHLSFEDFLDMLSALSPSMAIKQKAVYAFHVFDFDEDCKLGKEDIKELVRRITPQQEEDEPLAEEELEAISEHILDEADIDESGDISCGEFVHLALKTPDFMDSFTLRL